MELFAGVSHSFRDPIEWDHDKIALTPGWSDLDQNCDLETSVCRAAHGKRLRLDAAPRLQSLLGALSFGSAVRTTSLHSSPGHPGISTPPTRPIHHPHTSHHVSPLPSP